MKKILILLSFIVSSTAYSQDIEKGKKIFEQNCTSCHNMEKKLVGPPLQNTVEEQGREWTEKWIYNSGMLIDQGDKHANEIFNEYNKMAMPSYSFLAKEELSALVDYLEGYKEVISTQEVISTPTKLSETTPVEKSEIHGYIWIIVSITFIVIILSIIIIFYAFQVLDIHFSKLTLTNSYLIKKLNTDPNKLNNEIDSFIQKEVSKQVVEKVKIIKKDIVEKLKKIN